MTTTARHSRPDRDVAAMSLLSVSLTAILAAITHAYEFGPAALVVGAIGVAVLAALSIGFRRTGNRVILGLYALLDLWIIGGFGIVGGFWNHAVKAVLVAVHAGTLPPSVATWFIAPELGSVVYETLGILTFVTGLAAARDGYRFLRSARASRGAVP